MGLIIQKRSKTLFKITFIIGIINLILNIVLISEFGILGAAYATTIYYTLYYTLLIINVYVLSRNIIKIKLKYPSLFKYILL